MAYLHEYVHFIQAVSTFFGLNRLHTFLWSLSTLQKQLKRCDGIVADVDAEAYQRDRETKMAAMAYLSRDNPLEKSGGSHFFCENPLTGVQWVSLVKDIPKFAAYCKLNDEEGTATVYPIGARALQESMAMAMEMLANVERATPAYKLASLSMESPNFDYVVVSCAIRASLKNATDETIYRLTVMLCDVALNEYLPNLAFYRAWLWISTQLADLEDLPPTIWATTYECLRQAAEMPQAQEERRKCLAEIGLAAEKEGNGMLGDYLRLFLLAHQVRNQKPSAFVERLLGFNSQCPEDLKPFIGLPYYHAADEYVSIAESRSLPLAGLLLVCLQHFSKTLAGSSEGRIEARCPLLDLPGMCHSEKSSHCQTSPWFAPVEDDASCIYRASVDVIGLKTK